MKKELRNILVPVDFNEPSIKALKYAYNLAKEMNGELIILHVIQTPGILADFFSNGDQLVQLTNQIRDKLLDLKSTIPQTTVFLILPAVILNFL